MKEHVWVIDIVDGGHVGVGEFWECGQCGACGGSVFGKETKSSSYPFYADGSGLKLTDDCDESKRLIEEHLKKKKAKK